MPDFEPPSSETPKGQPRGTRTVGAPSRPRRAETRTRPANPQTQTSAEASGALPATGPRVVALGGGHGLAAVLMAARQYASAVDAIVSIADDGGSSGRLRRTYGATPPGDVRRCLLALANCDAQWSELFAYRFAGGELDDHAIGNLMLVALESQHGSFRDAIAACEQLLSTVGHIHPATTEPVVLQAIGPDGVVEGQYAVQRTPGLKRLELLGTPTATPAALEALRRADQIILAPGSLFTSVLPVIGVPEIAAAISEANAQVISVGNLEPEIPETEGLNGADHAQAILDHGGRIDTLLIDPSGALPFEAAVIANLGITCVKEPMAAADGRTHDPHGLARALRALL
ncbi:MAG: gluconeogenesis factor YvcK family protein [Acidimicrobiia bacterium]